jgi:drug/metabolite transporter (DMT)-like permease
MRVIVVVLQGLGTSSVSTYSLIHSFAHLLLLLSYVILCIVTGTTCHIAGMALTTANHGAFLLQLTTLIVPVMQGLRGEKIPRQIQCAVLLALAGIYLFTQDPTGITVDSGSGSGATTAIMDAALETQIQTGDALVLGAAFFYSIYDIQTFYWGKKVPRTELVTIKVGFQAVLACIMCAAVAGDQVTDYLSSDLVNWPVLVPTVLWSGLIVNALATFLQVGGMQAVGPVRAQTIFASQPLWAASLNYAFLGSVLGPQGFVGGGAFLGALLLAAMAEAPKPTPAGLAVVDNNE